MFIHHVEYVDNLINICGNAGQMDRQAMVEQSVGQGVEQPLSIRCENVNNGESL